MSIGSMIKENRTAMGLSPRRLEKKLGVSRGAVKRWEAGTTFPTQENLRRMEELFGCSLGASPAPQPLQPDQPPREEYRFRFTQEEVIKLRRNERAFFRRPLIICISLIVASVLLFFVDLHITQIGSSAGPLLSYCTLIALVYAVLLLKNYTRFNKNWSDALKRMAGPEYRLRLCGQQVYLDISTGERTKQQIFHVNQIIQLRRSGQHLCVTADKSAVFLPLDILPGDSFFLNHVPAREKPFEPNKQRYLTLGLCGFSVLFIIIGFVLYPGKPAVAAGYDHDLIYNLSLLGAMTLMGALYAFKVRKQLRRFAMAFAACLAAAAVLFGISEFCFQYNKAVEIRRDDSDYRELISLSQPEPFSSRSFVYADGIVCGNYTVTEALVLEYGFTTYDTVEEIISADPNWYAASESPLPPEMLVSDWDYILIYNMDSGEFGQSLSPGCEYIAASYDHYISSLLLVRFSVQPE